jgi:hypothetical protein
MLYVSAMEDFLMENCSFSTDAAEPLVPAMISLLLAITE